jgi:8-oxo-dGTP pyrophosphatase MutT (NUDIX family)
MYLGYIDHIESWQEGGAREVWEEAGLKLDPAQLKEFKILNGTGKVR